jgi:hypothetical protein
VRSHRQRYISFAAGSAPENPRWALLIVMDEWMSALFPRENNTIDDFAILSGRLRSIMGPHIVSILRQNVSIVLDFPANTVKWRAWMRSLIDEAGVAHELHFLDIPDFICKERLRGPQSGWSASLSSGRSDV